MTLYGEKAAHLHEALNIIHGEVSKVSAHAGILH